MTEAMPNRRVLTLQHTSGPRGIEAELHVLQEQLRAARRRLRRASRALQSARRAPRSERATSTLEGEWDDAKQLLDRLKRDVAVFEAVSLTVAQQHDPEA